MAFEIDVNVPKVTLVGVVSVVLLAVILLATHGYYLKLEHDEFAAKHYNAVHPLAVQADKAAAGHLHKYKQVDGSPGTVQLPIDEAIKIMAATKGRPPTTQPLGGS
ncbi:MAG TPA: hypothetical protein PLD59_12635 [Tepidisphaeraceae bacterium]|nr:hypothetical protein [Tepidisphaeraceae bacterium]